MISLADLVGPGGVEEFLGTTWGRQMRVYRGADNQFADLLPWRTLNEILRRHRMGEPRLRLARGGERVPVEEYTTAITPRRGAPYRRIEQGELGRSLREGATLVIDSFDELCAPVDELAADLERELRERVQVNLYGSFSATRGFDTHWDDHDVLVVQVHGSKHWRVFGHTRPYPTRRDVEQPQAPTGQPDHDFVLTPGDVLHVPRGWWHDASATDGASVHLTFGVSTSVGADLISWLADEMRRHEVVRQDLPRFSGAEVRAQRVKELAELLTAELSEPDVLDRFFADRDATAAPRTWGGLPFSVHDELPADPQVRVRLQVPRVALVEPGDGTVALAGDGRRCTFAAPAAPVLRALVDGRARALADLVTVSGGLDAATVRALCTELIRQGFVTEG
ncbi:MAG: cupin domain-containing protein [Sciscionella sp.]